MIVGIVFAVFIVVVIIAVVVIVLLKKKGTDGKRRASASRVADSGRSDLVSNEVKDPYRGPPTPQPMHPDPHPPPTMVRPASVMHTAPPPQVVQPEPVPEPEPIPQKTEPAPLPRAVTPIGPPSSHLPPLNHNPVLRPFTAAHPRSKGPVDHDPFPVDLDPETSREMGTPLPTYEPEPDEKVGNYNGRQGSQAGHVSYQNPAFDADVADDNDQTPVESRGQGQGHPISPPPPYSEN